jgi:hypothetical protein
MNALGTSIKLQDASGLIGGPVSALGICLKAATTGSISISGVVDSAGSPVAWTINGGSSGFQAAPGAASSGGGQVWYALANVAADAGKAIAFFETR